MAAFTPFKSNCLSWLYLHHWRLGVQCCWNKLKARTDKSKRLRPETEGAQQHALSEAATAAAAAAAMENTLDAKDREQRSSTDFDAESRDAEGGKNEE